jgi:hypothetical protein
MSDAKIAQKKFNSAVDEYQRAVDALTAAISDRLYPSKVATVVYRFASGCMELGRAKERKHIAAGIPERDGKRGLYQESCQGSEKSVDDFLQVQERIDRIRREHGS